MYILLTNDDGVRSPLLAALSRAAAARGHKVLVSAPASQQSAKSHAFTISGAIMVNPATVDGADQAWAVEGTPVDSARIGMKALAQEPIDLVISGINNGYNIGLATYVSGTIGAAREAAFQLYSAIAASIEVGAPEETKAWFADYVIRAAERVREHGLPKLGLLNLNCPPVPVAELKPAVFCRPSHRVYRDDYERRISPRGQTYFWLLNEEPDPCPDADSDVSLAAHGHITATILTPEGELFGPEWTKLLPEQ